MIRRMLGWMGEWGHVIVYVLGPLLLLWVVICATLALVGRTRAALRYRRRNRPIRRST